MAKKVISFVTTNMNKLAEVSAMLPDYTVGFFEEFLREFRYFRSL